MAQFGKAPGPASFGRRPSTLSAGGRRASGSLQGQRPSHTLSSEAQSFLNNQKRPAGNRPTSGSLEFLGASTASTGIKYGEKPVAWIRVISYLIDLLIIGVPFALIAWPMFTAEMDAPLSPSGVGGAKAGLTVAGSEAGELVVLKYILMYGLLRGVYAIAMEASSLQATLGKLVCGIIVTNREGGKPGLGGVIMRNTFGRIIFNILPFYIGYWLLIFNSNKRGLHDMMSGTMVCRKGVSPAENYSAVFA